MFVGHYAPALLAKAVVPETRLWKLFIAAQALDIAFDLFVFGGVERLALRPGVAGPLVLDLQWLPYSHSLVVAVVAAAVCAGLGWGLGRAREGLAIGLVVASHWVLDLVVHTPDLHLWISAEPRLGLGLWRFPLVALGVELACVIGAAAVLVRRQERGRRRIVQLTVALCVVQLVAAFGPPPSAVGAVIGLALLSSALWVVAAWRVDP